MFALSTREWGGIRNLEPEGAPRAPVSQGTKSQYAASVPAPIAVDSHKTKASLENCAVRPSQT